MALLPICHPWPYLALHSYCTRIATHHTEVSLHVLVELFPFLSSEVRSAVRKSPFTYRHEKRDKSARTIPLLFFMYDVSRFLLGLLGCASRHNEKKWWKLA